MRPFSCVILVQLMPVIFPWSDHRMSIKRLLLGQQSRARAHERYWDLSYIGIHLCRLGEKLINRNLKSAGHDGNSTKEEKISTTCAEIVAGWVGREGKGGGNKDDVNFAYNPDGSAHWDIFWF